MVLASSAPSRPARSVAPGPERLFVALWPDADIRARLARTSTKLAATGRRIPEDNLHLTLAFLGAESADRRHLIIKAMHDAKPVAFDLTLDSVGHFPASRIVWLGTTAPPAALLAMQKRLATRLLGAGFKLEDRAFRPHVTLARNAAKSPDDATAGLLPILWPVRQWALVRSRPGRGGSQYEVVAATAF